MHFALASGLLVRPARRKTITGILKSRESPDAIARPALSAELPPEFAYPAGLLTPGIRSFYNHDVNREAGGLVAASRLARAGCNHAMAITYYKRFRMEIDLDGPTSIFPLPPGFVWVPWEESLMEQHAEVKYRSFIGEVDAYVFPCLGDRLAVGG